MTGEVTTIHLTTIYEGLTADIDSSVDRALRSIYAEQYTGPFNEDLWKVTTRQLNQAVDEIYSNTGSGGSDKLFSNKIKYQNSLFSAFKSANQTTTLRHLKMATQAKTFTEFKKQAISVTDDYNKNWLKAEYRAAKARIRSAKKFRQAEADADLYANIEYMPSVAAEPREEHKQFYHMIRPINDPIWNTHLPPLTWGCQCQWRTTDADNTGFPDEMPAPDPGLDINPATGQIFSNSHPYFENEEHRAAVITKQNIAAIHFRNMEDLTLFARHGKSNGVVYSFERMGKERANNLRIAKIHASKGNEVELFGADKIDSRINGIWNEFKSIETVTANAVDKAIQKGNRQFRARKLRGDITLELPAGIDRKIVLEALKLRLRRPDFKADIYGIHFIIGGKYKGFAGIEDIFMNKVPL